MGIVQYEVLTCDFCGKEIADPAAGLKRELTLRKPHVNGRGRCVQIVLHVACEKKLTRNASQV
jgi:hypothetical protein